MVKRAGEKRAGRTGRKVGLCPSPPGAWPLDLNLLEINLSALPSDPHPPGRPSNPAHDEQPVKRQARRPIRSPRIERPERFGIGLAEIMPHPLIVQRIKERT